MNDTSLFQNKWRWPAILLCHLGACLLMLSWLWQPAWILWNRLDYTLFSSLNHPLANGGPVAFFWALTNMRLCDLIVAGILLCVMCWPNWFFQSCKVRYALFGLAGIFLLMLLLRAGFHEMAQLFSWDTRSPSLRFDQSVRLTHLYHLWKLRDASHDAFPGDHSGVLMVWGLMLSAYARNWKIFVVWGLVLLFSLPRLVAGAHAISDDIVGGGALALISFSWGFFTPFAFRFSRFLDHLTRPMLQWLHKIHLPVR